MAAVAITRRRPTARSIPAIPRVIAGRTATNRAPIAAIRAGGSPVAVGAGKGGTTAVAMEAGMWAATGAADHRRPSLSHSLNPSHRRSGPGVDMVVEAAPGTSMAASVAAIVADTIMGLSIPGESDGGNPNRSNHLSAATLTAVIANGARRSRATNRIAAAKTLDCFAALAMTATTHRSAVGAVGVESRALFSPCMTADDSGGLAPYAWGTGAGLTHV